jgi:FkbM family methyltransferase
MGFANRVRRVSPRLRFYVKFLRYKFYNGAHEIRLVRHLLVAGSLAIDVGSSIGFYSYEMAKYASKVVAFEANPQVAAFARSVAPRRVEVLNLALSSSDGEMTLRVPIGGRTDTIDDLATIEQSNRLPSYAVRTEKVATKRLDDFNFSDCGFIKIDVEGHEEAVLDGATRLIETQRPALLIELDDRFNPGIVTRVLSRLSDLAYTAHYLSDGRLRPLGDLDPRDHPNIGPNFIFVPREAESRVMARFRAA